MNISVVTIASKADRGGGPSSTLLKEYLKRAGRYVPCSHLTLRSEAKLLEHLEKLGGRSKPALIVADSRGRQMTSPEWAEEIRQIRDRGTQWVLFAVGPPHGWSAEVLKRVNLTVSFGRITLPHDLAAVVLAEQIYRALTILTGHPYHTGH